MLNNDRVPSDTSLFHKSLLAVALLVTVAMIGLAATLDASADRPPQSGQARATSLGDRVNDMFSLSRSEIAVVQEVVDRDAVVFDVPFEGDTMRLRLHPHSVRAAGHRVWVQLDDGSNVEVEPGPESTVRGVVEGPAWAAGAEVAGSVLPEGLLATILLPDGRTIWIEPIAAGSRAVAGAQPGQHVVYDAGDTLCEGVCGTSGAAAINNFARDRGLEEIAEAGGAAASVCKVAELGVDADFQYYQALGSSVTNVINRINNIINTVNILYEEQCGIRHEITEIVIRTSAGANPYTSNNAEVLLGQFRSVWNSPPESSIPRDVAHLFTGRNLGSILGIAYLSQVCNISMAYGLSRHQPNFSCQTDLVAHELGHNWSAPHCSCPSHTMNPSITCANNFHSSSISAIVSFRNSRPCLHDCPPPWPDNNTCATAFIVGEGSIAFTNYGATTTGPDEPALCDFGGDTNVQSDVWYRHAAQCDGLLTVSLCGSSYFTKLAVYSGACPTQPNTAIACDVFSCPDENRATVTFPVTQGEVIRIRVGGHGGAQGDGILSVSCSDAPPCPADLNGDNVVDVLDLLLLLDTWGTCVGCAADLNGDGVVDVLDLLLLLDAWGSCS
jgi:hypothetical protein